MPIWQKAAAGGLFALLLTFLLLLVVEVGLSLSGIGQSSSFYIKGKSGEGEEVFQENRWFALPYFTAATIRRPQHFKLKTEKPEGEYRIFILGSSAAMGDPEASFSAGRMLQRMFERNYPEVNVQVINAAMTAVNSHTVRRIARDCSRLEPDAFIVYEGNNEVIGPYGPTGVLSVFSRNAGFTDGMIFLRERRISQLLLSLWAQLNPGTGATHWGGMQMFLDQRISSGDPRLETVRLQFERNLRRMIRFGLDADADVILNTVLVNQRSFAPFQSADPSLPSEGAQWHSYLRALERGDDAMGAKDWKLALHCYLGAWSLDQQVASLAFKIGRAALAAGEDQQAGDFLKMAMDLDTLRFRTCTELNESIRELAKEYHQATHFDFLDVAAIFSEASPHGIPGDEWLYEHVHLNVHGNYQLARMWYLKLVERWVELGKLPVARLEVPGYQQVCQSLGYTLYEQGMIANELLSRFEKPPFLSQSDANIRQQVWSEKAARISELLRDPDVVDKVKREYLKAIESNPQDFILQRNFGMFLCAFSQFEQAVVPLTLAVQQNNQDPDLLFAYAVALRETGAGLQYETTRKLLLELEPRYPGLEHLTQP